MPIEQDEKYSLYDLKNQIVEDRLRNSEPLYVSIKEAADIAGLSEAMMREWANRTVNPIPHIVSGTKRLINVGAIPGYAISQEKR